MLATSITQRRYKPGSLRDDGYIFRQYAKRPTGEIEVWLSPKVYHKSRVQSILKAVEARSLSEGIIFNLDLEYLLSIFPVDYKCPITHLQMTWGRETGMDTSPSLDRIVPNRGYTKGNVVFISMRMNRLKQDASINDLKALLEFYEPLINSELH